jgi:putative ABC transport system substrate-binding protein
MDRRTFLGALAGSLLAAPLAARAQQAGKVYRIGVLGASRSPSPAVADALGLGLLDHRWIEGENFVFVKREADALEGYPQAAAELVARRLDVIVTGLGEPGVEALKHATMAIPIVMQVSADPVGSGLVASLARPGGNVTGMSILAPEVAGKRLELLEEAVPRAMRVAVLWNATYPSKAVEVRNTEVAARRLNVIVHSIEVRGSDALVTLADPLTILSAQEIVRYATANRLPMISEVRQFADAGALVTYGPNLADLFRRAAGHVDRILRGALPGDLPVEQPTKFELLINLKTAKALGLTIPPSLLQRADQVIE